MRSFLFDFLDERFIQVFIFSCVSHSEASTNVWLSGWVEVSLCVEVEEEG